MSFNIKDAYLKFNKKFILLITYTSGINIESLIHLFKNDLEFNIVLSNNNIAETYNDLNTNINNILFEDENKMKIAPAYFGSSIVIFGQSFPSNLIKFNYDLHIHISISKSKYYTIYPEKSKNDYDDLSKIISNNKINKYFNIKDNNITNDYQLDDTKLDEIFNFIIDYFEKNVYKSKYDMYATKNNISKKQNNTINSDSDNIKNIDTDSDNIKNIDTDSDNIKNTDSDNIKNIDTDSDNYNDSLIDKNNDYLIDDDFKSLKLSKNLVVIPKKTLKKLIKNKKSSNKKSSNRETNKKLSNRETNKKSSNRETNKKLSNKKLSNKKLSNKETNKKLSNKKSSNREYNERLLNEQIIQLPKKILKKIKEKNKKIESPLPNIFYENNMTRIKDLKINNYRILLSKLDKKTRLLNIFNE